MPVPSSAAANRDGGMGISKPAVHAFQQHSVEKQQVPEGPIQMYQKSSHDPVPFATRDTGRLESTAVIQPFQLKPGITSASPVIQMVKYVKKEDDDKVVVREDNYRLKRGEIQVDEAQYKAYLFKIHGPQKGKKHAAPVVVEVVVPKSAGRKGAGSQAPARYIRTQASPADLIYRGMSVNNIFNLRKPQSPIFTVQNPDGEVTPEDHIVEDDPNSPYLSFEAESLSISAGKYAPKPVDDNARPLGVSVLDGGFLKQEKSYTGESQEKYEGRKRIGMVAGIRKPKDALDFSTPDKAQALKSKKAQDLAVADKEVLVKPGKRGITPVEVPFLAKVQRVDKDYFVRHINNQSAKKALGFFNDMFYKIQIQGRPPGLNMPEYSFSIPEELLRKASEASEDMSDIDEMEINLRDFEETDEDGVRDDEAAPVNGEADKGASSKKEDVASASSSAKPKDGRDAALIELSQQLLAFIRMGTPIEQGRGEDASADDLRAMHDERYALSGKQDNEKEKATESGTEKETGTVKKVPFDPTKWDIKDYGAGGDCLFRALNASDNQQWANALRREIVTYQQDEGLIQQGIVDMELGAMLESSPHEELNNLAPHTAGLEGFPVEAYHRLMAFQGTWGGRAEISAFTSMRNRIVYVVESTGGVTRYAGGQGQPIPQLPPEAFSGRRNIVLYKTANHWQRIHGPLGGE